MTRLAERTPGEAPLSGVDWAALALPELSREGAIRAVEMTLLAIRRTAAATGVPPENLEVFTFLYALDLGRELGHKP